MTVLTTDADARRHGPAAEPNRLRPFAPGWPGIPARWTSSAKSGIGTAVSRDSRVWFTLSHGILNEVYYPRVDHACTRDLGFIVTDGRIVLLGGKARHPLRDVTGGARHSGVSDSQHRR